MRKAVNDINRCVACGVCAKECPRDAISIFKGCYAVINHDKCVGCGNGLIMDLYSLIG